MCKIQWWLWSVSLSNAGSAHLLKRRSQKKTWKNDKNITLNLWRNDVKCKRWYWLVADTFYYILFSRFRVVGASSQRTIVFKICNFCGYKWVDCSFRCFSFWNSVTLPSVGTVIFFLWCFLCRFLWVCMLKPSD